jgi:hypothetical protein
VLPLSFRSVSTCRAALSVWKDDVITDEIPNLVFGELTSAQVDELKKMDEDNLVDEEELYLPDVDDEGEE